MEGGGGDGGEVSHLNERGEHARLLDLLSTKQLLIRCLGAIRHAAGLPRVQSLADALRIGHKQLGEEPCEGIEER